MWKQQNPGIRGGVLYKPKMLTVEGKCRKPLRCDNGAETFYSPRGCWDVRPPGVWEDKISVI